MKKNKYVTRLYLFSLLFACNGLCSCAKRVDLLGVSQKRKDRNIFYKQGKKQKLSILPIANQLVADGSIEPSTLDNNNLAIVAQQILIPDLELPTEQLTLRRVLIELIDRGVSNSIDPCEKKSYSFPFFKFPRFLKPR